MIKDTLVSFRDNLRDKTTNPFFGTLIIVWSLDHWRLLYSLLNFDSELRLKDRILHIESYLSEESYYTLVMKPVLISVGVIIISYILINISRLIINFHEKIITPWVYRITDKSSIVLRSDYDVLIKELELVYDKLEQEKELKLKAQNERDILENKAREKMKEELIYIPKQTNEPSEEVSNEDKKVKKIVSKIIGERLEKSWKEVNLQIKKDDLILMEESFVNRFIELGLIKKRNKQNVQAVRALFDLTDLGLKVNDSFLNEELS